MDFFLLILYLGGGFKYFWNVHPILGEMIKFDLRIFLQLLVETTNQLCISNECHQVFQMDRFGGSGYLEFMAALPPRLRGPPENERLSTFDKE